MTIPTLIALLLSGTALVLSTVALFAALRSSARSLRKLFGALSDRFTEVEHQAQLMHSRILSIRSQVNSVGRKSVKSGDPELTAAGIEDQKDEWTRAMNLKIARGEIKAGR